MWILGGGLERITMVANNCADVIKINHGPILDYLEKASNKVYGQNEQETRAFRIIADHLKAAVFLIADGVIPSNTDRGYYVRRLIRRSARHANLLGIKKSVLAEIVEPITEMYREQYPELSEKMEIIKKEISTEEEKFRKTLANGLTVTKKLFSEKKPLNDIKFVKVMESSDKRSFFVDFLGGKFKASNKYNISESELKQALISGSEAFDLFQSYGFPLEMIDEIATEERFIVDHIGFRKELEKHQTLSRTASAGKFKGGLADAGEETKKLHTATHLLRRALEIVFGQPIKQKGSNIYADRLRFDFAYAEKLTAEQIKHVEDIVNEQINKNLPVTFREMPLAEARDLGAAGVFDAKYGDRVKVYFIGQDNDFFSKEICGGPHIDNTGAIGKFKIQKEESSSAGIRRIKAIVS
jgi:alanyl-tRNA synthetase